jgi:hypothetical protein
LAQLSLTFSLISISLKNREATEYKEFVGQLKNQSIVQQLTKDGNIRTLVLKASPIGEKYKTICRNFLIYYKKKAYKY